MKGEELQNGNGSAKTQPPTSLQTPSQAIEKEGLRLWHILDNIFRTPKSAAYFMIAAPVAYSSPRASAATQLLLDLLQDSLNETTYLADVAGLEYSVSIPSCCHFVDCARGANSMHYNSACNGVKLLCEQLALLSAFQLLVMCHLCAWKIAGFPQGLSREPFLATRHSQLCLAYLLGAR